MEKAKCYYCDEESKYTQPGKNTGKIIDVCEKHFDFKTCWSAEFTISHFCSSFQLHVVQRTQVSLFCIRMP